MKSLYSFLLVLALVSPAMAQNKVGNGGDGIFCKKNGKNDGKLLDFYEANVKLTLVEINPEVIAEKQIAKLKDAAPELYNLYSKRLKELPNEIEYKEDVKLTDIKDSMHLFEPLSNDCKVYQLAIRKAQVTGDEKRFLIRKDLWNRLPPTHKAGLLTHEIIYEHLSRLGETDSIKARKLNTYLFSNVIKTKEFWNFIKELEIPIYPQ